MTKKDLLSDKIRLNIGGLDFVTYEDTLKRFPESKLANLSTSADNYDDDKHEYFFDRNPVLFAFVLDAYRKGEIHLPSDICGPTFRNELEFWELSLSHVAPCCWKALYKRDDDIKTVHKLMESYKRNASMRLILDYHSTWRKKLWLFLEDPYSSKFAMAWVTFISILVIASTVAEIMLTLPEFSEEFDDSEKHAVDMVLAIYEKTNHTTTRLHSMKPNWYLNTATMCCQIILTFELVLSLLVCPAKKTYVCNLIRISVTLGYVAYWVSYAFENNLSALNSKALVFVYVICRYGAILRLARLFYLSKGVPAFNVVGLTFSSSIPEFKILIFLLGILVCVFGYMMFATEFAGNENMGSIFATLYWALVTLTTVGYGDIVPYTRVGHAIASLCAVCGIIVLALPVGIIASTFNKFYNFNSYVSTHVKLNTDVLKEIEEQGNAFTCKKKRIM
ncbi:hypothetical protein ACF0H5_001686 [Mactra antiquata]